MRTWLVESALSLAIVTAAGTTASAQPGPSHTPYVLEDRTKFEWGCIGPCMCPIGGGGPVTGTFRLRRLDPDPLFEHYEIDHVEWLVQSSSGSVSIKGKGTYDVGGEVAAQQQMILDLEVNGAPPLRFASGWVNGGGEFPRIDIPIHSNPEAACRETVITLHAVPQTLGVEDLAAHGALRVSPNPFDLATNVGFTLRAPAGVELRVYDVSGRPVRRLASGLFAAGPHARVWDGRADEGAEMAPGLYFVRIRAEGRESARVVVKIR